jgi:hypothetical protein
MHCHKTKIQLDAADAVGVLSLVPIHILPWSPRTLAGACDRYFYQFLLQHSRALMAAVRNLGSRVEAEKGHDINERNMTCRIT